MIVEIAAVVFLVLVFSFLCLAADIDVEEAIGKIMGWALGFLALLAIIIAKLVYDS